MIIHEVGGSMRFGWWCALSGGVREACGRVSIDGKLFIPVDILAQARERMHIEVYANPQLTQVNPWGFAESYLYFWFS